jgi:hypothetical protein
MNRLFAKGPHALRLASILNSSVRGRILAAEARLALLARKPHITSESI